MPTRISIPAAALSWEAKDRRLFSVSRLSPHGCVRRSF